MSEPMVTCHVCKGEKKTQASNPCMCCGGVGEISKVRQDRLFQISRDIRQRCAERGIEIPEE